MNNVNINDYFNTYYDITRLKQNKWLFHHTFITICRSTCTNKRILIEKVLYFIFLGIDINYITYHPFENALIAAIKSNNVEIVQILLDNDVNIYNYDYIDLIITCDESHTSLEIMKLLLNYSARFFEPRDIINKMSSNGFYPLENAIKLKRIYYIELLLKYGANIYIRNKFKSTVILSIEIKNLIDKYDYIKNGARCIIRQFLIKYVLYKPNGIMYKRALKSFNNLV